MHVLTMLVWLGACALGLGLAGSVGPAAAVTQIPQPLTLGAALDWAVQYNPTLRAAEIHLERLTGRAIHADVAVPSNPRLEVGVGQRSTSVGDETDLDIRLSQELWIAGQGGLREATATQELAAAQAQYRYLVLLYMAFSSLRYAALIYLNVPFAITGGIFALWLSGLYLSVAGAVGFIAVFGVAVMNGVVLVSYINQLRDQGLAIDQAVRDGAENRLRPVLMTATTAIFGLVPMILANGIGANVQRPLAVAS